MFKNLIDYYNWGLEDANHDFARKTLFDNEEEKFAYNIGLIHGYVDPDEITKI